MCRRLADSPENTTTSRKEGLHPQPHAIRLMRPCSADSLLLPPPHVRAPPLPSQGSMSAGRHAPLSSDLSLPTSLCSTPGEVPGARRMKYRQRHRAVLYISPCNFVSCSKESMFGSIPWCRLIFFVLQILLCSTRGIAAHKNSSLRFFRFWICADVQYSSHETQLVFAQGR